jgi:hypothetical protein
VRSPLSRADAHDHVIGVLMILVEILNSRLRNYSATASHARQSAEKMKEGRNDKDGEMGSVSAVRYELNQFDETVHPFHAQNTGFTTADLALLRDAVVNAFEFDQSSNQRPTLRDALHHVAEASDGVHRAGNERASWAPGALGSPGPRISGTSSSATSHLWRRWALSPRWGQSFEARKPRNSTSTAGRRSSPMDRLPPPLWADTGCLHDLQHRPVIPAPAAFHRHWRGFGVAISCFNAMMCAWSTACIWSTGRI